MTNVLDGVQPPVQPEPFYPPPEQAPRVSQDLAVIALALGIIAFLLGLVPFAGAILGSIILGLPAVGIGIFAVVKKQPKDLAVTGLILGFIGLITSIVVTVSITSSGNGSDDDPAKADTEVVEPQKPKEDTAQDQQTPAAEPSEEPTPEPPAPDVPAEYISALKSAQRYSDSGDVSKVEVYRVLTSEHVNNFSPEAAQYAVDNVQADWKENALQKAIKLQKWWAISPQEVRDILVSPGIEFTPEEADYAIANLPK